LDMFMLVVINVAYVAVAIIISFFIARRILKRSLEIANKRIEAGEQGELPLWRYKINVGSWLLAFGLVLFLHLMSLLFLVGSYSDIEKYAPALKLSDLINSLNFVTGSILAILGLYFAISRIIVEREVRKRVLSIVHAGESKIYFVNLGEPVIIRQLALAIVSGKLGIFGFPEYYFLPLLSPQTILLQGDVWKVEEAAIRNQLVTFYSRSEDLMYIANKIGDKNAVLLMAFDEMALAQSSKYLRRTHRLRPMSMCFLCTFGHLKESIQNNTPIPFVEWMSVISTLDGKPVAIMRMEPPKRPRQD